MNQEAQDKLRLIRALGWDTMEEGGKWLFKRRGDDVWVEGLTWKQLADAAESMADCEWVLGEDV